MFNTHYHSAAIEFYRLEDTVQLKLTLSLVLDRPRNPRPQDNFARTILGSLALFPCHLSKETSVNLWNVTAWTSIKAEDFNALKVSDVPSVDVLDRNLIFTPMKYMGGMTYNTNIIASSYICPLYLIVVICTFFCVSCKIAIKTGYGQEYGEIIVEMTNHLHDKFLNVLYVEVLPWYIRPYLHSLRMEAVHNGKKYPVPPGKLMMGKFRH